MKETSREILYPGPTRVVTLRHFESSAPRLPDITTEVSLAIVLIVGVNEWDESQTQMGILLQYRDPQDNTAREAFNGHDWQANLLVWIRALWFLSEIPIIDYSLFSCALYFLAEPSDYVGVESELEDFLALIGATRYQELRQQTPFELASVCQCLALLARFPESSVLHELSDEVRAGSIRWSQELRAAGVKHPDYWDTLYQAKVEIVGRYQAYMRSYTAFSRLPYDNEYGDSCYLTVIVEWEIAYCVERGIEQEYGPAIAFLMALLRARIKSDETHLQLQEKSRARISPEEWTKYWACARTPPSREDRFDQAITWFLACAQALQPDHLVLPFESYQGLLWELYNNYHQLQIHFPLVPGSE